MAQFTLYSHKGPGPNPLKAAILLQKLGLSFDVVDLDFGDDPERGVKSPKFLKVNPNGRVPALVDHNNKDFVVWESGAILYYLADKYDSKKTFLGTSAEERAVTMQWLTFQLSGVGPTQGQVNYAHHYWEPTYGEAPCKSVFTRYEGEIRRLYQVTEDQLAMQSKRGSSFIALDRPTIADFSFYPWINIAGFAKIDLAPYPHLTKWYNAMKADKDVQEADSKLPK